MELKELCEAVLSVIGNDPNGYTTNRICRTLRLTPQELGTPFEILRNDGKILGFAGQWFQPAAFAEGIKTFADSLNDLRDEKPAVQYFPIELILAKAKLAWTGKTLDRIVAKLVADRVIEVSAQGIRSLAVPLQLSTRQVALLTRVTEVIETEEVNTPTPHVIAQTLGIPRQAIEEILKLGIQTKQVICLDEVVYYTPSQIEKIKIRILSIAEKSSLNVEELRTELQTTRKYISPLMDYFDRLGVTEKRDGERIVISKPEESLDGV